MNKKKTHYTHNTSLVGLNVLHISQSLYGEI